MFAVRLGTGTPQYVTGYEVVSLPTFNKAYQGQANVLFIKEKDLKGKALEKFINSSQNFYYDPVTKKLTLDTTKP
jgi:hypothetical protein